jgi:hypothetical protein
MARSSDPLVEKCAGAGAPLPFWAMSIWAGSNAASSWIRTEGRARSVPSGSRSTPRREAARTRQHRLAERAPYPASMSKTWYSFSQGGPAQA